MQASSGDVPSEFRSPASDAGEFTGPFAAYHVLQPLKEGTPMVGRTLGHYRIAGQLGIGGMGIVYAAEDTRLRRKVALKVLPPDVSRDLERRARFEREAQAVAALNHPGIVTIYSVEEDEGVHFISMELVEGVTLAEVVRPGGLTLRRFLELAVPLTDAVAAAHAAGITHRDIKPQNVMVTSEGRVKVLDFGLAKFERARAATSETTTDILTSAHLLGTVPYMSPEQVRGELADQRSDVFSLGTVLYELATGSRPFDEATTAELISSILRDAPRPVTDLNLDMPPRLNRVIERCLEKDPRLRPQNAGALRNDFDDLRRDPGATPTRSLSTIAVLPFSDMSAAKDQEYFCEGMAEEIINALTRLEGLHVASRMSSFQFKAMSGDSKEIGRRLGVATLLEGSVRKAGDRLRITTQIIDVASGYHVWSERYDRRLEDIFKIQDEIADSVVRALRVTLRSEETMVSRKGPAASVEAYDYYLRGRHYVGRRTSTSAEFAREMFSRAIELDPEYGLAYAELAHCHSLLYELNGGRAEHLEQADAASRKAIELAPDLSETHAWRGLALSQARRFDEAESEYRAALRLNARMFEAYYGLARDRAQQGRFEEAVALLRQASDVSPEDYQALSVLSVLSRKLGRNEEAEAAHRQALTIIERKLDLNPDDVRALTLGASALLSIGDRGRSLAWTARAVTLDPEGVDTLYNGACVYSRVGETEKALDLLEKLVGRWTTQSQKSWLELDGDIDSLRDHPRFISLFGRAERTTSPNA